MDANKIDKLLRRRCGRIFLGVFAIDRLPRLLPTRWPLILVCNTDPHDRPGEHWIVLFIAARGEYFDSFAEPPRPTFELYLNKYCNSWTMNNKRLQSVISSFCGHYCIFYCLFKYLSYDMHAITNVFTDDTALNDYFVHTFVCDMLQ